MLFGSGKLQSFTSEAHDTTQRKANEAKRSQGIHLRSELSQRSSHQSLCQGPWCPWKCSKPSASLGIQLVPAKNIAWKQYVG